MARACHWLRFSVPVPRTLSCLALSLASLAMATTKLRLLSAPSPPTTSTNRLSHTTSPHQIHEERSDRQPMLATLVRIKQMLHSDKKGMLARFRQRRRSLAPVVQGGKEVDVSNLQTQQLEVGAPDATCRCLAHTALTLAAPPLFIVQSMQLAQLRRAVRTLQTGAPAHQPQAAAAAAADSASSSSGDELFSSSDEEEAGAYAAAAAAIMQRNSILANLKPSTVQRRQRRRFSTVSPRQRGSRRRRRSTISMTARLCVLVPLPLPPLTPSASRTLPSDRSVRTKEVAAGLVIPLRQLGRQRRYSAETIASRARQRIWRAELQVSQERAEAPTQPSQAAKSSTGVAWKRKMRKALSKSDIKYKTAAKMHAKALRGTLPAAMKEVCQCDLAALPHRATHNNPPRATASSRNRCPQVRRCCCAARCASPAAARQLGCREARWQHPGWCTTSVLLHA